MALVITARFVDDKKSEKLEARNRQYLSSQLSLGESTGAPETKFANGGLAKRLFFYESFQDGRWNFVDWPESIKPVMHQRDVDSSPKWPAVFTPGSHLRFKLA